MLESRGATSDRMPVNVERAEAGSYSRLVDFVYHSTLCVRVMTKKKRDAFVCLILSLFRVGVHMVLRVGVSTHRMIGGGSCTPTRSLTPP